MIWTFRNRSLSCQRRYQWLARGSWTSRVIGRSSGIQAAAARRQKKDRAAGMLHAVMLGSGPGRERREWYPGFYLQRRRLGCRMNRGEQETLFRQSRQITRIVPSREDLVLSVLKSPISQQQQQRQQYRQPYQSHFQGHFNCQGHPDNKKCNHPGIRE